MIAQPITKDKDEEDLGPLPPPDNSDLSKRIDALEIQQVLLQKQNQETITMCENLTKPLNDVRGVVTQITDHLKDSDNAKFTGEPKEANRRGEEEKEE